MNKEKYRKKKKNILKRNFINKFVQKNAEGMAWIRETNLDDELQM